MASLVANSLRNAARSSSRSKIVVRYASTSFRMPAMSPTMTEGGISSWKVQEGSAFATGDILVEVETDKATIDVEAQEDGVMGKILSPDGTKGIPVGQIIAILAEEGDDLSSMSIPSDISPPGSSESSPSEPLSASASSSSSKKDDTYTEESHSVKPGPESKQVEAEGKSAKEVGESPTDQNVGHGVELPEGKPMFPSVMRLLSSANLSASEIKKITSKSGTGRKGMLTKGDVLFALGKIKDAKGTAAKMVPTTYGVKGAKMAESTSTTPPAPNTPLTGSEMRRLILSGMEEATKPARPISASTNALTESLPASSTITDHEFEALLSPYASLFAASAPPAPQTGAPGMDFLLDVKNSGAAAAKGKAPKDEWEGLF